MREKDTLILHIEGYGMEGEGVAHEGGYTFFVPYAMAGERVKVAVDRVKGSVAFAHIIKMLEPSPARQEAACPLYGKCGGCSLRHIPYEMQKEIKRENVRTLFYKNAGIELADLPIVGSDTEGYRNKVALPFGVENGRAVLGMYKRATHRVLPLSACPLHGKWIEPLISETLDFVREHKISVYDERSGKGLLRHLVARRLPLQGGFEYSVILVVNGNKIPYEETFADRIAAVLSDKANVYICKNTLHNNVILTPEIRTLRGEDHIRAEMCGGVWEVSPLSFLQVNFPVAESIYEKVVSEIPEGGFVVDAYSGTGIMSALIANRARKVVGIEVIRDATLNAAKNAEAFGVGDKVTHLCGEVEKVLPDVVKEEKDYTLVVDPPRAGLDPTVIDTILACPPESILYVSCSPATLTRDIGRLEGKYALDEVKLFDMFPGTPHVETFVSMRRRTGK